VVSIKCEGHNDCMSSKQLLNKTSTEHNKKMRHADLFRNLLMLL
jgi:hypothetical protein